MFSIEKLCFEVFVICKHVLHAFFMEVSASLSFVIDEVLWVNKNIFRCKFQISRIICHRRSFMGEQKYFQI